MSRNADYKFVSTDSASIVASLIMAYERITGHTLQPAEPDRLFISWVADTIIKERVNQNYIGNQNIPSRADGANLDALGEWIYSTKRKPAQSAKCMVRFVISAAQETSISIPRGTRVSDASQNLVWTTTEDALIAIGELYADVMVQCATTGSIGNGYTAGQINTLIDIDNILFYSSCSNITESDGGAEEQDDNSYFESMRMALDSYSTAGAEGSYIYWAKSVSDKVADVKAVSPTLTRSVVAETYTSADNKRFAFVGGEQIDINTLEVYDSDFSALLGYGTDYTANYSDGLLKITLKENGAVATANAIGVTFEQVRAGYVYIYALMDDGTIATDTIKTAIYDACNSGYVRPLTDCVEVKDPEIMEYDISCVYYISEDSPLPLSEIQTGVANAVNEYIAWQSSKLGRDINPDKLKLLMLNAGVKRVVITSPVFTSLRSGANNDIPQIASVRSVTVTNGGYEDE